MTSGSESPAAVVRRLVAAGKRALFLDRGGTLARIRADYDACFIVSNQARVSKGEISETEVLRRFAWANEQLGRPFTGWLICPHDDADGCACRKPKPGMFLELAERHDLDLAASTHVGDSEKDRNAASAASSGRLISLPGNQLRGSPPEMIPVEMIPCGIACDYPSCDMTRPDLPPDIPRNEAEIVSLVKRLHIYRLAPMRTATSLQCSTLRTSCFLLW